MNYLDSKRQCAIDYLKILLTLGIVFRHAFIENADPAFASYLSFGGFVTKITEVCVPLFFVISGFLFFVNVPPKPGVDYFWGKWKKRFGSLLIPYIIANCLAFAVYFAANKYAPQMLSGFLGDKWLDPIFIFWKGPINLSLWFIRELIILVLLSPLIYLFVRYLGFAGVLALGALWMMGKGPAPLFLFSAGAAIAVVGQIASIKEKTPKVAPRRLNFCKISRSWCFFVYLYHYIPMIVVKKVLVIAMQPTTDAQMLLIYFLSIAIVLGAISLVFIVLRKWLPGVLKLLAGGR